MSKGKGRQGKNWIETEIEIGGQADRQAEGQTQEENRERIKMRQTKSRHGDIETEELRDRDRNENKIGCRERIGRRQTEK